MTGSAWQFKFVCNKIISNKAKIVNKAVFFAKIFLHDLCAEVSKIFRYDRMGPKIAKAMNETIEHMIANKTVFIIDKKMHVRGEK